MKYEMKQLSLTDEQRDILKPFFEKIQEYQQEAFRLRRENRGSLGMLLGQIFESGKINVFLVSPEIAVQLYDLWRSLYSEEIL